MAMERYDAREQALGEELMGALERFLLLQIIDERWREHLFDMDYLREGIHLRGFAQIDPLVAIQERGLHAVRRPDEQRLDGLRADDLQRAGERRGRERRWRAGRRFAAAGSSTRAGRVSYSGGQSAVGAGALAAAAAAAGAAGGAEGYGAEGEGEELMPVVEQRVVDDEHQVGRNDPCWCGSGKKFKKCHGA